MSNPRGAKKSRIEKPARLPDTLARWLLPAFIFLATVMAFFPVLENGFVDWDDAVNLLENPRYRGLGWSELGWMFTTFHMGHYQPLSWVTLGLDYLVWGMDPFGYHLTNLLLHAVNGVIFYFVALRLLSLSASSESGRVVLKAAAGFAALFFAVHPLRVESVAWATERRDVLSGLFFLGTILCYLRANAAGESGLSRQRWLTAAVLVYGLSLLSKVSGVTLPVVLALIDVYPLGRLGNGPGKWFGAEARRVWREKLPFLALALAAAVIAPVAISQAGAMSTLEKYGILARLAQASFGLIFYLWKTVLPVGLSPLYELPTRFNPSDWPFVLSGVMVVGVSMGLLIFSRWWPAGLAIWIYYAVMLAPVLGIAQNGPQFVADRYGYLSCLGWALLAGAALLYCYQWAGGSNGRRAFGFFAIGLVTVVLVGLGILTWKQVHVWHDSETLWRHVLTVTEKTYFDSSFAHYNLGTILAGRGETREAIGHYHRALEIYPTYAKAHYNLGNALAREGKVGEAVDHYRQALRIDPVYTKAHLNLGIALARLGDLEGAMEHYRQLLQIDPMEAKAHYNLGAILAGRGKIEEAVDHFRQALRIEPEFAEAHESLGRTLARQGKRDEAIQHYQEALRILKGRSEAGGGAN